MINNWNAIISKHCYGSSQYGPGQYPPFERFCKFINSQTHTACDPFTSYNGVVMEANDSDKGNASLNMNKGNRSYTMTKFRGSEGFITKSSEERTASSFNSKVNVEIMKQDFKRKEGKRQFCRYCKEEYDLKNCKRFVKLDPDTNTDQIL